MSSKSRNPDSGARWHPCKSLESSHEHAAHAAGSADTSYTAVSGGAQSSGMSTNVFDKPRAALR